MKSPRYTLDQKLALIRRVQTNQTEHRTSTAEACRKSGVNHTTYVRWNQRLQWYGLDALKPAYANCGRKKKVTSEETIKGGTRS